MAIFGRRITRSGCRKDSLNLVLSVLLVSVLGGKALAEEGIVEINEARALAGGVSTGDTAGYPVTISEPGSYALTGNLIQSASTTTIMISADDVDLDLRGFKITNAIATENDEVSGARARNGSIGDGNLVLGPAAVVEDIKVTSGSIIVGMDSLVSHSAVSDAGSRAIRALDGSVILANRVEGAQSICILASNNVRIEKNKAKNCGDRGIDASFSAVLIGNIVTNGGSSFGISTADGSLLKGNIVRDTAGYGYRFASDAHVALKDNVFENNNGGNSNPQGLGGISQIGSNMCGGTLVCP